MSSEKILQKSINRLGLEKPANYDEYFSQIRNYYYEKLTKISKKDLFHISSPFLSSFVIASS